MIAVWVWFGISWIFIFALAYSRWRAREHADQAATEAELTRTRQHVGDEFIWDA